MQLFFEKILVFSASLKRPLKRPIALHNIVKKICLSELL